MTVINILSLPEDILRLVAVALAGQSPLPATGTSYKSCSSPPRDLLALALSCKRLCRIAYPVLWHHTHLEQPETLAVYNSWPTRLKNRQEDDDDYEDDDKDDEYNDHDEDESPRRRHPRQQQHNQCSTDRYRFRYRWTFVEGAAVAASQGEKNGAQFATTGLRAAPSSMPGADADEQQEPKESTAYPAWTSYVTPVVSDSYTNLDLTRPIRTASGVRTGTSKKDHAGSGGVALMSALFTPPSLHPDHISQCPVDSSRCSSGSSILAFRAAIGSELETSAPPEKIESVRYICNGTKFVSQFYSDDLTSLCKESIKELALPLDGHTHSLFSHRSNDNSHVPIPGPLTGLRGVYVTDMLGVPIAVESGESEDEDTMDLDQFKNYDACGDEKGYAREQEKMARFLRACINSNTGINLFNTCKSTLLQFWKQGSLLAHLKTLNLSVQFYEFDSSSSTNGLHLGPSRTRICVPSDAIWVLGVAFEEMCNLETLILCDTCYETSVTNGHSELLSPESISQGIAPVVAPLWMRLVDAVDESKASQAASSSRRAPFSNLKVLTLPNSFCGFVTPIMIPRSVQVLTLNTFFPHLFEVSPSSSCSSLSTTSTSGSSAGSGYSLTQLSLTVSHDQYLTMLTPSYSNPNTLLESSIFTHTRSPFSANMHAIQVWVPQWGLGSMHSSGVAGSDEDDNDWNDADLGGLDGEGDTDSVISDSVIYAPSTVQDNAAAQRARSTSISSRGSRTISRSISRSSSGDSSLMYVTCDTTRSELVLLNILMPLLNPNLVQIVISTLPVHLLEVLPEHCPLLEVFVVENWDYQTLLPLSIFDDNGDDEGSAAAGLELDDGSAMSGDVYPNLHSLASYLRSWPLFAAPQPAFIPTAASKRRNLPQSRRLSGNHSSPPHSTSALNRALVMLSTKCGQTLRFLYIPVAPSTLYSTTLTYMLLRSAFALNRGLIAAGNGGCGGSDSHTPAEEQEGAPQVLQLFIKSPFRRRLRLCAPGTLHSDPSFFVQEMAPDAAAAVAATVAATAKENWAPMYSQMISTLQQDIAKWGQHRQKMLRRPQGETFAHSCTGLNLDADYLAGVLENTFPQAQALGETEEESCSGGSTCNVEYPIFSLYKYLVMATDSELVNCTIYHVSV